MDQQPGVVRVPHALALIAAALRQEPVDDPPPHLRAAFAASARDHGVAPLLARSAAFGGWHPDLQRSLREATAAEAVLAIGRERELRHLLDALAAEPVPSLLIKGAHLSRSCYPSPECRPHGDLDILIDHTDRAAAGRALERAGYERLVHVTGNVAFTQVHYWRDDRGGMRHAVDLHWRIASPRVFADRLAWDELNGARSAMPAVHASAAGPSDVHALILACIHRTAHHGNTERLIWLYDIHALANRLDAKDWEAFAALADTRGLAAVALDGLGAAGRWLGTVAPAAVTRRLAHARSDPAVSAFLRPRRAYVHVALSDLRALPGWRLRLRFVREHLFPDRGYMARRYGTDSAAALPFLYARRFFTGVWRWFR